MEIYMWGHIWKLDVELWMTVWLVAKDFNMRICGNYHRTFEWHPPGRVWLVPKKGLKWRLIDIWSGNLERNVSWEERIADIGGKTGKMVSCITLFLLKVNSHRKFCFTTRCMENIIHSNVTLMSFVTFKGMTDVTIFIIVLLWIRQWTGKEKGLIPLKLWTSRIPVALLYEGNPWQVVGKHKGRSLWKDISRKNRLGP